jgi:hypothetical protein
LVPEDKATSIALAAQISSGKKQAAETLIAHLKREEQLNPEAQEKLALLWLENGEPRKAVELIQDATEVVGDGTVYRWRLIVTNTGPGGTGQRVRISGFEVWKIGVGGLIAESRGTFDRGAYQRQFERGFEGSQ